MSKLDAKLPREPLMTLYVPPPASVRRLANGALLRAQQQPWAQRVGVCLRVAAGSHDEPPDYPGLAHFLEHLLFLGSRNFAPDQGLMAFVQCHGGLVNASTQARHTDFVCELPAELLQPALTRLLDMLCQPLLDIDAQLREREVLHAEYLALSQDADSLVNHALGQALAVGHRCSDFLAGDRSTLLVESEGFQQALRAYHQRHYQARYMCLTLVGPQVPEQLLDIAEALLGPWPSAVLEADCTAVVDLLPLRASRLSLQHDRPAVHLGFAAQIDACQLQAPLELLLDTLHDPASGGLLAGLRERQLCRQLQVRELYRHQGQCLLRFDFPGATTEQGPALRAAVQSWAAQLQGHEHWPQRLQGHQQAVALRLLGLSSLALAQHLQAPEQENDTTLRSLAALLGQLAQGDGLIELQCSQRAQSEWPATGLALPLQALPAEAPLLFEREWQLCSDEPLLDKHTSASAVLPLAGLRHYSGQPEGGPAALYWRGACASSFDAAVSEAALLARSADLRWRGERLGITSQLSVNASGWTLALQGPAALLPTFSAQLLPLLLAPVSEPAEPLSQGMLLRMLLQRLPQLCELPAASTLQGLSVGLDEREQAHLAELCTAVAPLTDLPPASGAWRGIDWHEVPQPDADSALLLFCPLPDTAAPTEAAWRLLGQLLQGRFYQRLRGELQLGYALFAGFRQVQGSRGLLFALQSPVCDAAGIFAHIHAFLDEPRAVLEGLDDATLSGALDALQATLSPAKSNLARAEQLWQLYLAGLPEAHPQQVSQALTVLSASDLLRAYKQLLLARDWRVLASGAPAPV